MAGGQWEVVGGKSKKVKQKNGVLKKEKKKQDNTSSEVAGVITETENFYSAFMEKEKKEAPKQKGNSNDNVKNKDKSGQQKKKKDKKNVAPTKISLEETFTEVNEVDLKNLLATMEVLCPGSPLVWLKDIASFFNVKLDTAVEDPVFTGKPLGYPSILLSKGVSSLLLKTFNRCTPQMLQHFFEHCLNKMVQDSLKGLHVLGFLTILQCLAQEMPSVATANLSECRELISSHQNRQNICLSLMWVMGQAGNNNLEAGFKVWTDLMFPLIGTKTCTTYAVDYLEKLVCYEDLSKVDKSIIGVKNLFHILDFICSKDLVKSVQKRLISLYPTLKTLSYGPEPETVLRNYFPSYLHRLDAKCSPALKEEILSSLVYCLEKDIRNYSIWRQLYSKHFQQSKLLIAHLNEQWEKLSPKFPKKCLFETLSVFQVTNEELLCTGKKDQLVEECIITTKNLLLKINSQMFSWIRLLLICILIVSLLLTIDILIHDSFTESLTGKFMKNAGLLVICAQAGEKLSYYYGKTYKLLEMYVPTIFLRIRKSVGPYIEEFWLKLTDLCIFVWKSSSDLRNFCGTYIKSVLIMVDAKAPIYGRWILNESKNLKIFLFQYLQAFSQLVWSCSESVALWLQNSVFIQNFIDSFLKYSVQLTEYLQYWVSTMLQNIKSYIPS